MKNNLKLIIGSSICLLALFSCNKEFLSQTDPTRLSSNEFYKDAVEIDQAVVGAYGQLQGIINDQWRFNELPSDNTTIDFNPDDRGQAPSNEAFEFWQWIPGTSNLDQMYIVYYNAIYNINNSLSKISDANATDSAKNVGIGQLKFLRAYYYFELTQYFGDVVLILTPIGAPSEAFSYERVPSAQVYSQIEADLTDAISNLPLNWNSNNVGRVTKGAAQSLLGKVYLTLKQYDDAVNTLTPVLTMGYELVPNYADVFDPKNKNNIESVFEVQYQGGNNLGEWSSFAYTFSPRFSGGDILGFPQANPGGWNIPTNDLINSYESGDKRKDASIGLDFVSPVTGEVVPYIKKYVHPHSIVGRTDDDWPVIRFSDVLLMLSEAINEKSGPSSEAFSYLNRVRNRAGLPSLSGLSQSDLRVAIDHERRVELAFENWRWFDLKRTKSPDELTTFLNAYGSEERAHPTVTRQGVPFSTGDYIFQPFKSIYAIPSDERRVNNNLTQNAGY